ncbi:flagellar hook-associated protein FlgL [Halanaerobium congolense]|jgi:flagellar hook-associated protein 3 FlgL|uniref:Flagellar hook-associated protein 3 FlgL n=1 Tax=Halanaerobium congolense TaxID=54121 RepID=A0A4R7DYI9_9FIRM|nr:flagellar hook-associated protein FlgL [Halanaerobium congolense]TDS27007.1 flagellar hook-associated protein 3 FlgL [Halanaerobium congolense]
MRVTNSMMVRNMLDHLKNNMGDLNDLNEQLSSGKLFQKPSDAPIKVADSMNYKSQLNRNSQYQRNLGQAENWLNTTESALKSGTKVIQRARELTIYAANDSMTSEDRKSVAQEMKQLRDELVDISNAKLGDSYIFSGQKTDQKPFEVDNSDPDNYKINYNGDEESVKRRLNENVEMNVNLNGKEVFEKEIKALNKIYDDLESGKTGEEIGENLSAMDTAINDYAELRSQIGGKLQRTGNVIDRLEANEIHLRDLKSKNENADLAEVITELKMEETVYRASLASGSRIMQQSLVDFIR